MRLSQRCKSIISGETGGLGSCVVRALLCVASLVYAVLIRLRNRLYDRGWLRVWRLDVPVICVGNITAGGTGKTPMVVWLCRLLGRQGLKVAVLSRGYKSRSGDDEIRLLRDALADVPVVVDPDRVRGGRRAVNEHGCDILVLDDGFQHRRLARDLDIVLIDCTCPFGYGAVLPRGLLREPIGSVRRAGAVVLTRTDLVSAELLSELTSRVRGLLDGEVGCGGGHVVAYCEHRPIGLFGSDGAEFGLDTLSGTAVAAFCGIGNPEAFIGTLEGLGARVVTRQFLEDHHAYSEDDCARLADWFGQSEADIVVTTEKDWVKLKELPVADKLPGLRWLRVESVVSQGRQELETLIGSVCCS